MHQALPGALRQLRHDKLSGPPQQPRNEAGLGPCGGAAGGRGGGGGGGLLKRAPRGGARTNRASGRWRVRGAGSQLTAGGMRRGFFLVCMCVCV
jgi:hypothetical protein